MPNCMQVIVREKYILWSDRQLTVGRNGIDKNEKKRWNKCIQLLKINKIENDKTDKKERRFIVGIQNKEYIFRAKDKRERNKWVKSMKDTVDVLKTSEQYHLSPTASPGPNLSPSSKY